MFNLIKFAGGITMKKVHKKILRQAISSILAAAMSLSLFTNIPASAGIGKNLQM